MVALAFVEDLEARTAADITDRRRANALLDGASATVRAYCGQQFTAGTDTIKVQVRNGVIRLPQRPVTAVTAVTDTYDNELEFDWVAGDRVDVCRTITPFDRDVNLIRNGWVIVTYTHGFDEVPPVIVEVVCQIAARALGSPAEQSGVQSETLGPYSYSTGAAAAAGTNGLLQGEKSMLNLYRRQGSTAWVA